jgi:hypothetical protein
MAIPRRRVVNVDAERAARLWRHLRYFGMPLSDSTPPRNAGFRALVDELGADETLTVDERIGAAVAYLDGAGLRDSFDRFDVHLEESHERTKARHGRS